jgi:hypothetical protein
MSASLRPKAQANDRTMRLRAIARSPSQHDFDPDEEVTRPGTIPSQPEIRAAGFLTTVLQSIPPHHRLIALFLLLGTLLAGGYLWLSRA